jgi:hypothetical protein
MPFAEFIAGLRTELSPPTAPAGRRAPAHSGVCGLCLATIAPTDLRRAKPKLPLREVPEK